MANLFGKNRLSEKAAEINTDEIIDFIEIVKTWHADCHDGSLKNDKETSREQEYNQSFFKNILGYKEKPTVPYNFEPKATTKTGHLPDAVISYTDKSNDIENIAAVVELKGASVDLDRPQRREGNMSPVQQGFKYKTLYRNCPFVVVSNFWEFRLYHDNLLDYEVWTLDDLVNPDDDYILFKTWYTLLKRENFTAKKGASKTEDLLSDIRIEQEEIGKDFYKVYKKARLSLLRDIIEQNQVKRGEIDLAIEKTQKIIDRIVFACFAEDRGLFPDDTLRRVIKSADESDFDSSLWFTFKAFFESVNSGSEKLGIADGYNGGLFAHDAELNNLKVGDRPLRQIAELGGYNFVEDLSVTILGHIFEQSISDLEEIKNKVNEKQGLDAIQQSRRKKDGIFYTPDYIVRYIVDNSLGAYLREAEERLKDEFRLHGDINEKNYEKRERQAYGKYQDFLQNVKVLDPACGSGAFLVYVFDYLLAENKRVASILGNSLFSSEDYIKDILRNNIYGVDLNEESVEITKLSLWLKSAQKGKKLTSLDDNIKCGNSLIDDPEIASDKAFDWQKEFPSIFADGGFDVVVGNPPWVSLGGKHGQKVSDDELKYYIEKYNGNTYMPNLFEYFINLGINLLSTDGYFAMIVPDRFGINGVFNKLRKQIWQKHTLVEVVYKWDFPFIVTDTMTFVIKKQVANKQKVAIKANPKSDSIFLTNSEIDEDSYGFKAFKSKQSKKLIDKILDGGVSLSEVAKTTSGFGGRSKLITIKRVSPEQREILKGQSIGRYLVKDRLYFEFTDENVTGRTRDENKLSARPKVLLRKTGSEIIASFDDTGAYPEQSLYFLYSFADKVQPLYILALLNSRLITWLFRNNYITNADSTPQLKNIDLDKFPIVIADNKTQAQIAELASGIVEKSKTLYTNSQKLNRLVSVEFSFDKLPAKLNRWWTLDFADFANALKVKLSLQQKDELLQLFEKYRTECAELDAQIQKTNNEIDQLVYKLYNLTPKEIQIVETGA
ncbi:MAG: TaqI-like C-terminal specificity domain-containing protein [Candidatus Saccharibacteria bacterium]|nr:TaqI-like C-terminal specificity domain-containing protein [Candidatus Saccharibacteria bacterium]